MEVSIHEEFKVADRDHSDYLDFSEFVHYYNKLCSRVRLLRLQQPPSQSPQTSPRPTSAPQSTSFISASALDAISASRIARASASTGALHPSVQSQFMCPHSQGPGRRKPGLEICVDAFICIFMYLYVFIGFCRFLLLIIDIYR